MGNRAIRGKQGRAGRVGCVALCGVWTAGLLMAGTAAAQTCTTQAKLPADVRSALADQALSLGLAIKANDGARVQAQSAPLLAGNFAATAYLVRTTSERIAGDSLAVTQLYLLDASTRPATDTGAAEFSCALSGTPSETDFAFNSLPGGMYAFAMVEGTGPRPWLLSLLLEQKGSSWQLAGLYTHARTAAGRNGLSFWTAAREAAKAKDQWRAWLLFSEADALLAPAPFVDSSHLDRLRAEQRDTAPPELADGISAQTPMVLKDAKGESIAYTAIGVDASDDGMKLRLVLHYRAQPAADAAAGRARNLDAAQTFLDAHRNLRSSFDPVNVFGEVEGQPPFATEISMADVK
jgi:hypothetical protein